MDPRGSPYIESAPKAYLGGKLMTAFHPTYRGVLLLGLFGLLLVPSAAALCHEMTTSSEAVSADSGLDLSQAAHHHMGMMHAPVDAGMVGMPMSSDEAASYSAANPSCCRAQLVSDDCHKGGHESAHACCIDSARGPGLATETPPVRRASASVMVTLAGGLMGGGGPVRDAGSEPTDPGRIYEREGTVMRL